MLWDSGQAAVIDNYANGDGHTCVTARAGCGKCLGRGTPVLRYDGTLIAVEDVRAGDKLMGPDSSPRTVLVISQGAGPLFKVEPVKGEPWVCNDAHVLTLTGTNRNRGRVIDIELAQHLDNSKKRNERPDRNWKLFRVGVDFRPRRVPFDPYLVGLWLGDGTLGEAAITNADPEIRAYCEEEARRIGLELRARRDDKNNTYSLFFRIVGGRDRPGRNKESNELRQFFRSTCVDERGVKTIPRSYMVNSRRNRLRLLAGLLDADGFLASNATYELTLKDDKLAEQVVFVARSLGFAAYRSTKTATIRSTGFAGVYNRVSLSGNVDELPCLVERRRAGARRQIKRHDVTGFSLTPIGVGEYFGFTLDGDGRFLLGDFTVTHNTTVAVAGNSTLSSTTTRMFCAHQNSNRDDLAARLDSGTPCRTIHSLALKALSRRFRNLTVDENKGWRIVRKAYYDWQRTHRLRVADPDTTIQNLKRLVKLAKETHAPDRNAVVALAIEHGLDDDVVTAEHAADIAIASVRAAVKDKTTVDYDDQVFLPAVLELRLPEYDLVTVDEVQDVSPAQMWIVRQSCRDRLIAIGDPMQRIFSFRGAGDAFRMMREELNATELKLSVTYRCPRAVVDFVRRKLDVTDLVAAPDAPEGEVDEKDFNFMLDTFGARPGDAILSRVNAPLIEICRRYLHAGRPATILGADFGRSLISLVRRPGVYHTVDLIAWLQDYLLVQLERLKDYPDRARQVEDQVVSAMTLAQAHQRVDDVIWELTRMFGERGERNAITLATVHKAKGLEWRDVWILADTFVLTGPDELNCQYVACTRARRGLYVVRGGVKVTKYKRITAG